MLTAEQLEFFNTKGYLVVEDVFDQEKIIGPLKEEYSDLIDDLYDGWLAEGKVSKDPSSLDFFGKLLEAYKAGCDWFQPMDISLPGDRIYVDTPMHFGPAVFNMMRDTNLLNIVEQLIGPEITSNPIQHVRIKPPAKDLYSDEIRAHITSTDWHQDRGVALEEADQTDMVTIWCAITDATVENGCLQVIPKTEETDILPHCPMKQTAIAEGFIDKETAVPLPVKSGGIVIFHPLTPHSSLANVTDGFRWSFDIRYSKTGQPTGRAHFPDFVARSRSNPSSELHSVDHWRAMWEDARARLAINPHIDIHRWQSDSPVCA